MTADLTGVIDARVGDCAVDRVYAGDRMAWNRYNWVRWSCDSREDPSCSFRVTHTGSLTEDDPIDDPYAYYTGSSSGSAYVLISGKSARNTTVGALYDSRHRYIPADVTGSSTSCRLGVGDSFFLIASPKTVDGVRTFSVKYCTVYQASQTSYVRGGTCYGTVIGSVGQYPSNGRHADGYWYVAAPAQGFPEVSA